MDKPKEPLGNNTSAASNRPIRPVSLRMAGLRSGDGALSVRARPSSLKRNRDRRTNEHRWKVPGERTREARLIPEPLSAPRSEDKARREPARTGRGPYPAWSGRSRGCQLSRATADDVPVACPIGRSTPGTCGHSRLHNPGTYRVKARAYPDRRTVDPLNGLAVHMRPAVRDRASPQSGGGSCARSGHHPGRRCLGPADLPAAVHPPGQRLHSAPHRDPGDHRCAADRPVSQQRPCAPADLRRPGRQLGARGHFRRAARWHGPGLARRRPGLVPGQLADRRVVACLAGSPPGV